MNTNTLKFKDIEEQITDIVKKVNDKVIHINNPKVIEIANEFKKKMSELKKKITLEIAFVGQYSAGKSTIISALTGNKDIEIGQDITTDKAQAYKWGNVLLIDTPGIYAGRPEHDKISIEYMNKADLIVYVITTQGFTAETAKNFKKLAFKENRVEKIMLVINKSSQGDKELSLNNWISDAEKVTAPKKANDLYLSVIDAKDYLEALDIEDPQDRQDLIEYSGFNEFINNLNNFISQKGILGKLITPLNLIQDYLNRIINQISSGDKDTKNLLELLRRKQFRLIESKRNITNIVNGHIDTLVSEIKKEGYNIANLIEKSIETDELENKINESSEKIHDYIDNANIEIAHAIESEFVQLQIEIDTIIQSNVAQELLNKSSIEVNFSTDIEGKGFDGTKIKSGANILNKIGHFAEKFSINTESATLGAQGLAKVSGSAAHKTVYQIGKFFGHNFKPYEAVKIAEKIGKIGSILSKFSVILPPVVALYEQHAENKYEKKIKKERQKIGMIYDEIAAEVKRSFKNQFQKLVSQTYDLELKEIQQITERLKDSENLKNKTIQEFQELLNKTCNILRNLP